MAFLAERARRTAVEFGKEPRDPPLLEGGDRPEFRADWWRIRDQIAHEVFH